LLKFYRYPRAPKIAIYSPSPSSPFRANQTSAANTDWSTAVLCNGF
jgi:hypothetical protein